MMRETNCYTWLNNVEVCVFAGAPRMGVAFGTIIMNKGESFKINIEV